MIQRTGQNLTALFESWSTEFAAKMDRVFHLIGGAQHGELGANREVLFRNFLRSYLPGSCTVSTGFVLGEDKQVTRQQDVIIWDSGRHMPYMREGEFVVVPQESVMALIEVKTELSGSELKDALEHLHHPMFRNWYLAEPNPWDSNAGHQSADVPFRGILALRGTSDFPTKSIFQNLAGFYDSYLPRKQRREAVVRHIQDLRYVSLIDSICVLGGVAIHQYWLSGELNGEKHDEPCFVAWQADDANHSSTLAWFLFNMYQEMCGKVVSPRVRKGIEMSRGQRARPFVCRLDGIRGFSPTQAGPHCISADDIYQPEPALWT